MLGLEYREQDYNAEAEPAISAFVPRVAEP